MSIPEDLMAELGANSLANLTMASASLNVWKNEEVLSSSKNKFLIKYPEVSVLLHYRLSVITFYMRMGEPARVAVNGKALMLPLDMTKTFDHEDMRYFKQNGSYTRFFIKVERALVNIDESPLLPKIDAMVQHCRYSIE